MTRKFLLGMAAALLLSPALAFADEGMWLLHAFEQTVYPRMVQRGVQLRPGEIYDVENDDALFNAVVSLDFGCTGSMISQEGLMITNHHCAYSDIHALSTSEHNYLEDGFWAATRAQEKPIPGKKVFFLKKVADVTQEMQAIVDGIESEGFQGLVMRRANRILEKRYAEKTPYEVSCASAWGGLKHYLFFYEVYTDVRLVGAPPASIGAFGGETDNWGWPQHKGDFALYRIYTGPDGKPAGYAPENIPYEPARYLTVSSKGVKDGDYAMIMGYPGKTNRYASSFEIREKQELVNPVVVKGRRTRLDVWKKAMDSNPRLRLMYADKYFGISNYCDYAKWENICLQRYGVAELRAAQEQGIRETEPGLLERMEKVYGRFAEYRANHTWWKETLLMSSDWVAAVRRLAAPLRKLPAERKIGPGIPSMANSLDRLEKNCGTFDMETDRKLFQAMLELALEHIPERYYSDTLKAWVSRFQGDAAAIADHVYRHSLFADLPHLRHLIAQGSLTQGELMADPAILAGSLIPNSAFQAEEAALEKACGGLQPKDFRKPYTRALYALKQERGEAQYPDANSTLRLTYGTVGGIVPRDAVAYDSRSTVKGFEQKEDPDNYEFHVGDRLKRLLAARDWGRWGEDGELYVDFLTDTDITGGNSGSPVMNARGELIGLAFDGNRESMSGDVYYHPRYSKTVCVDIRFVMWIIEKYAGADDLLREMDIN